MGALGMHTQRSPEPRLLDWLEGHGVEYELHHHRPTATARETARAEGVDPRTFAKTVAVAAGDGRRALLVLDAADRLDLMKARRALQAADVHLLAEAELIDLAPTCDPGTMPPVGSLFDVPVLADYAVRDDPEITFNAGSHEFAVRVDRAAWEREAGIRYADLAEERTGEPAWMA